jgi:hypothetical protein
MAPLVLLHFSKPWRTARLSKPWIGTTCQRHASDSWGHPPSRFRRCSFIFSYNYTTLSSAVLCLFTSPLGRRPDHGLARLSSYIHCHPRTPRSTRSSAEGWPRCDEWERVLCNRSNRMGQDPLYRNPSVASSGSHFHYYISTETVANDAGMKSHAQIRLY